MTTDQNQNHQVDGISEDREQRPPAYFNVLFYGLIIWGVIFMAYYLFSGWSSEAEFRQAMAQHEKIHAKASPPPAASAASTVTGADKTGGGDAEAGEKIYAARCAMCHGAEGEGGIGPNLKDDQYLYGGSFQAVHESIAKGRPRGMPAFGNQLSASDIDNLTAYVLSLSR